MSEALGPRASPTSPLFVTWNPFLAYLTHTLQWDLPPVALRGPSKPLPREGTDSSPHPQLAAHQEGRGQLLFHPQPALPLGSWKEDLWSRARPHQAGHQEALKRRVPSSPAGQPGALPKEV